ncbi:hypothetical protein D1872_278960 [compost metagenome]
MSNFQPVAGSFTFLHPTPEFTVDTEFAEEAIILTVTYTDGTVAKRYEYNDGRPSAVFVNKPIVIDPNTNEARIAE